MKTLTPSIAQQIAKDIAPQITNKSMSEFFLTHSANVVKIAKILGKQQNLDTETLEIAGRVHDIGYCKDIDQHRDFAIPILENLNYEVNDVIKDCILHHGFQDNPTTPEGKIFQIADKLSIFDAETIECMIRNDGFPLTQENLDFLKSMSTRAIDLVQNKN